MNVIRGAPGLVKEPSQVLRSENSPSITVTPAGSQRFVVDARRIVVRIVVTVRLPSNTPPTTLRTAKHFHYSRLGARWRGSVTGGTSIRDALPPGSYLVVSHAASGIRREPAVMVAEHYRRNVAAGATLRGRDEILRFFTGLDLVDPGLVQVPYVRECQCDPVGSGCRAAQLTLRSHPVHPGPLLTL